MCNSIFPFSRSAMESCTAEVSLLDVGNENLRGHELGRWCSALSSSSQCLHLSLALEITQRKQQKNLATHTYTHTHTRVCVCRMYTFVCVCFEVVIRLWRWCLCIEGSCPVCQRALSATLFSDKASVKGLTPTGHGCWGRVVVRGEQQQQLSSCLALPAEKRLSEPPSPLLRLVDSPTITQEGHIWPYLSMCTAGMQHTPVSSKKKKKALRHQVCWNHKIGKLLKI